MTVYVVTRWVWGGGGDDDREVLAVCATEDLARAQLLVWGEGAEYTAHEVIA